MLVLCFAPNPHPWGPSPKSCGLLDKLQVPAFPYEIAWLNLLLQRKRHIAMNVTNVLLVGDIRGYQLAALPMVCASSIPVAISLVAINSMASASSGAPSHLPPRPVV